MARKRSVLYHAVQSILKYKSRRQLRQKLAALLLALLTLLLTFVTPNLLLEKVKGSEGTDALKLELQGKYYYDRGQFADAAQAWQKAANAYGNNEDAKYRNLINKATALQSLGLYPEACNQLVKTFTNVDLNCNQLSDRYLNNNKKLQEDNQLSDRNQNNDKKLQEDFIKNIKSLKPDLNKVIGLRLFGEILQRLGKLELSKEILEISLQTSSQYPEEKNAIFLSLGNTSRAIANKNRDLLDEEKIFRVITKNHDRENKSNLECYKQVNFDALSCYKDALSYYESAANTQKDITKIQAKINQLSLIVENLTWWTEQIQKYQDLLKRRQDFLAVQNPDTEQLKRRRQKVQQLLDNTQKLLNNISQQVNNRLAKLLPEIEFNLNNLSLGRESVYAYVNFTHSLINLKSNTKDRYFSPQKIAKLLSNAIQQARTLGDKQAEAEALINLARLYELQASSAEKSKSQNQLNLAQAENFTKQALQLYNDINIDSRQILYRHLSQLGRILKASDKIEGALESYALAWNILQSLREDLVASADNQFSFRQNVEPVYREFIDLLLRPETSQVNLQNLVLRKNIPVSHSRSRTTENSIPESEAKKSFNLARLDIARLVIESLQLAELDNFFQNPCSPTLDKPVDIADIATITKNEQERAAIIYPIILENRLEVILSYMEKNEQKSLEFKTDIPEKEVKNTLEDLANTIYNQVVEPDTALLLNFDNPQDELWREKLNANQNKFLSLSQKVNNWLIQPSLEQKLAESQIKTLVFVLDRPFQKIPIAALHDGKQYLIQKYNIALNLGQQLKDAKPLQRSNIKILAAGVSEKVERKGFKFPALENVKKELENIKNFQKIPTEILCKNESKGKKLCDEAFTKDNFRARIKSSPTIVHLGTHGIFSSNRSQTFILTGDSIIDIDDFQSILNPKDKIINRSIELLVLSACQTASGDERAALGMAGVALRSGASSTVATLWPVSDAATATLMKNLYKNLTQGQSRATALRNAQLSLLKDDKYQHPFYWAPFILAGNWL